MGYDDKIGDLIGDTRRDNRKSYIMLGLAIWSAAYVPFSLEPIDMLNWKKIKHMIQQQRIVTVKPPNGGI